ncbi:MAG: Arc family DNA-binding protein [Acidobacteria bacterium]|nr:Arc family DNA-binding protein [Acidobacteriota bacterium]MBA4182852.1 Arc family DNA-binding protein [Acidobacteriota bacterium]
MNSETKSEEIYFTLRLPQELNEKLVAEAEAERRSRQGHIVYLLEKNVGRENGKKEEAKK